MDSYTDVSTQCGMRMSYDIVWKMDAVSCKSDCRT